MASPQVPIDIEKLEQLYINGESDSELCKQAVLIALRLRNEFAFAGSRMDYARMKTLKSEMEMFDALRAKISARSTSHDVFASYKKFVAQQGIVL